MGARGLLGTSYYRRTGTANTLANTTNIQSVINVRNGGCNLVAGVVYEFEGAWRYTAPIGAARIDSISIGGTATFSEISFRIERNNANANSLPTVAWGVVTGTASTGGSQGFTTAFASQTVTITAVSGSAGATTLTTPQIPAHNHGFEVF
jgi:hypothetical protein